MSPDGVDGAYSKGMAIRLTEGRTAFGAECSVPVVVTPVLPGDPKPGEVWISRATGKEYEITGAPFVGLDGRDFVAVRHGVGDGIVTRHLRMDELRPKPTLKTYRLDLRRALGPVENGCNIQAESREAALAKLGEALEEVTP
jgi:hypothetical protein